MGRKRENARGFTFIEIMFVVVIIGLLTAIVMPGIVRKVTIARIEATKTQMKHIDAGLASFEAQNGRFPTESEGIAALVEDPKAKRPGFLNTATLPRDGWGRPFNYEAPGENRVYYDLWSNGPDGKDGSEDDVTNWQEVALATDGEK